jgi:hypothetical protein
MNQIKCDVVVAVAVLAIAAMIFTTGTSYMISIQDVQAKNRHPWISHLRQKNANMIPQLVRRARIVKIVNSRVGILLQ